MLDCWWWFTITSNDQAIMARTVSLMAEIRLTGCIAQKQSASASGLLKSNYGWFNQGQIVSVHIYMYVWLLYIRMPSKCLKISFNRMSAVVALSFGESFEFGKRTCRNLRRWQRCTSTLLVLQRDLVWQLSCVSDLISITWIPFHKFLQLPFQATARICFSHLQCTICPQVPPKGSPVPPKCPLVPRFYPKRLSNILNRETMAPYAPKSPLKVPQSPLNVPLSPGFTLKGWVTYWIERQWHHMPPSPP